MSGQNFCALECSFWRFPCFARGLFAVGSQWKHQPTRFALKSPFSFACISGTFAVVSLMVGAVVDSAGCGGGDSGDTGTTIATTDATTIGMNTTTETPSEGFSDEDWCRIRSACAVTLMAGIIQVRVIRSVQNKRFVCTPRQARFGQKDAVSSAHTTREKFRTNET